LADRGALLAILALDVLSEGRFLPDLVGGMARGYVFPTSILTLPGTIDSFRAALKNLRRGTSIISMTRKRTAALLVTSLMLCIAAHGSDKKDFSLTVEVLETKSIPSVVRNSSSKTECTPSGTDIDCTTRGSPDVTVTELVQIVHDGIGTEYELVCIPGAGRRFAAGFAQGAASSSGTLTSVERGCHLAPGTYKAKVWGTGFKVLVHDPKGNLHEWSFATLSTRRYELPSATRQASSSPTRTTVFLNPVKIRFQGNEVLGFSLQVALRTAFTKSGKYRVVEETEAGTSNFVVEIAASSGCQPNALCSVSVIAYMVSKLADGTDYYFPVSHHATFVASAEQIPDIADKEYAAIDSLISDFMEGAAQYCKQNPTQCKAPQ
jgi:hypothetical protein